MNNPEGSHFPESHFHAYLDGELSHSERDTFDGHLKTCSGCRSYLKTLAGFYKMIESLPEVEIERDLSTIVTQQIRASRNRSLRWKITLAAQLLASGFLFWFAWPLIAPYIQTLQSSKWALSEAEAVSMITEHINEISQVVNPFFEQLSAQLSGYVHTFDIALADSLVVPLLVSATLLWVIGNKLLLGERKILR